MTNRAERRVLAGHESYDALSDDSQAVVRARWDERITAQLGDLDLAAELRRAGDPWTEAAADGTAITRNSHRD